MSESGERRPDPTRREALGTLGVVVAGALSADHAEALPSSPNKKKPEAVRLESLGQFEKENISLGFVRVFDAQFASQPENEPLAPEFLEDRLKEMYAYVNEYIEANHIHKLTPFLEIAIAALNDAVMAAGICGAGQRTQKFLFLESVKANNVARGWGTLPPGYDMIERVRDS